ncbi:hypothetical protein TNCV_2616041 [Trichonephila clavipes]|nr:hypothetical protein TNCV_2616041 [Trichonephila clavipes]
MDGCCTKTIHSLLPVMKFLTSKNITVMGHPPYSPDLAPHDFFHLQLTLAEREPILPQLKRFRQKTENLVKGFPKPSFRNCYQQW